MKLNYEREIQRILAGTTRCKLGNGSTFLLQNPSKFHKYIAEEIYDEVYNDAIKEGIKSQAELNNLMYEKGNWTYDEEVLLSQLPKSIDDLKIQMFENIFRESEVNECRKILYAAKEDLARLQDKKSEMYHACAEGQASIEKNKYIIANSLYNIDGSRFLTNDEAYFALDSEFLEEVIYIYKTNRLNEEQIRQIAKHSSWRFVWSLKKYGNFSSTPIIDMSDEQMSLFSWSLLYDGIYEHSDCPSDEIIKDDDILDGWMLVQKRKREGEKAENDSQDVIKNEKIRDSQEIFIVATSQKDIERIKNLNSLEGDIAKEQRLRYVAKKGKVLEAEMPDSKMQIRSQFYKMRKEN